MRLSPYLAATTTAPLDALPCLKANLETLLSWLDPKRKPLLLQLPMADYERLTRRWNLPKLSDSSARNTPVH